MKEAVKELHETLIHNDFYLSFRHNFTKNVRNATFLSSCNFQKNETTNHWEVSQSPQRRERIARVHSESVGDCECEKEKMQMRLKSYFDLCGSEVTGDSGTGEDAECHTALCISVRIQPALFENIELICVVLDVLRKVKSADIVFLAMQII